MQNNQLPTNQSHVELEDNFYVWRAFQYFVKLVFSTTLLFSCVGHLKMINDVQGVFIIVGVLLWTSSDVKKLRLRGICRGFLHMQKKVSETNPPKSWWAFPFFGTDMKKAVYYEVF